MIFNSNNILIQWHAVLGQLHTAAQNLRRFSTIFPKVSRERRPIASYHTYVLNQARKFGPGCPWSYRNWVPPRQVKPKHFEVP